MSAITEYKKLGQEGGSSIDISFSGDLSASRVGQAVHLGGKRRYGMTFKLPASAGAARPTGVFAIQENMTGDDADWQTIPECGDAAWLADQPAGDGAAKVITAQSLETEAPLIRGIYTATSGGTGTHAEIFGSAK